MVADEFLGDDVEVGVGAVIDGAAAFAGSAGEGEFEIVGEGFDAAVVGRFDGGIAHDGFGELDGEGEFADALGAGEEPGAGEAVGGQGALELGDGAVLALDGEHGGQDTAMNVPAQGPGLNIFLFSWGVRR